MKLYKFDCLGRVPASIEELKKCELCQNEEICMGLSGGSYLTPATAESETGKDYQAPETGFHFDTREK